MTKKDQSTKKDQKTRDARFCIRLANSEIVVGEVHGSGGKIGNIYTNRGVTDAARRLRGEIARADAGEALGVYEPEIGCVRFYPAVKEDRTSYSLDIRGARVLRVWAVLP